MNYGTFAAFMTLRTFTNFVAFINFANFYELCDRHEFILTTATVITIKTTEIIMRQKFPCNFRLRAITEHSDNYPLKMHVYLLSALMDRSFLVASSFFIIIHLNSDAI